MWIPYLEHLALLALVHQGLPPQRAPLAVALAPMAVALGLASTLAWLNHLRPFQKAL